jgi:hypothetical protein
MKDIDQSSDEWKLCPICDHQYNDDDACQHVVAAYSMQKIDEAEEFGPIPMFSGILQAEDLLDIYLAADMFVSASLPRTRNWNKGLSQRLIGLLKALVASIDGELPDDFYFNEGGLSSAFDTYLQSVIRRAPTFQEAKKWEDVYGYGTYMTVVHWAEDAVRCAEFARKEIRADVECLQEKLPPAPDSQ